MIGLSLEEKYQDSITSLEAVWEVAVEMEGLMCEDMDLWDQYADVYCHQVDYVVDSIISHYELEGTEAERDYLIEQVQGALS